MCANCQDLFEPIVPPQCAKCSVKTKYNVPRCASCHSKIFFFENNHATFEYEELIRDMLHKVKFQNSIETAHCLGKLWASKLQMQAESDAIVVPLPLHRNKLKTRGFNQANILAMHVAKKLALALEDVLERCVDTPPQSGLHPRQRVENVTDAFAIKQGVEVRGKHFIIVDDIYTTGASVNECARILKESGAASIHCATLVVVRKKDDDDTEEEHGQELSQ